MPCVCVVCALCVYVVRVQCERDTHPAYGGRHLHDRFSYQVLLRWHNLTSKLYPKLAPPLEHLKRPSSLKLWPHMASITERHHGFEYQAQGIRHAHTMPHTGTRTMHARHSLNQAHTHTYHDIHPHSSYLSSPGLQTPPFTRYDQSELLLSHTLTLGQKPSYTHVHTHMSHT